MGEEAGEVVGEVERGPRGHGFVMGRYGLLWGSAVAGHQKRRARKQWILLRLRRERRGERCAKKMRVFQGPVGEYGELLGSRDRLAFVGRGVGDGQ